MTRDDQWLGVTCDVLGSVFFLLQKEIVSKTTRGRNSLDEQTKTNKEIIMTERKMMSLERKQPTWKDPDQT